ncbi:MAG TPA: hypothetical protein VGX23_00665 [Actinocrinis sp.]|nr:hypothetical protein [Actinocrinis sp.]
MIPGSEGSIPAIAGVLAAFRAHGRPIVHVIRLYDADGGNAELPRRTLVAIGGPVVRPGCDGSQLRAELHPPGRGFRLDAELLAGGGLQEVGPNEWVMYKPRWGAFYETPLGPHLCACGVDSVAVSC